MMKQQQTQQFVQQSNVLKNNEISPFEIGKYADPTLRLQEEFGQDIKMVITQTQTRGSIMKHTVYLIVGSDKNGEINVFRRFNQFFQMRQQLRKKWPGCFIPSIPNKTMAIKDDQLVNRRKRFLSDFLREISRIPYLYTSQQFQALIRSKQADISGSLSKWPAPSYEQIMATFKQQFEGQLLGKQINSQLRTKIYEFSKLVQKNIVKLEKMRFQAKKLAMAKERLDISYRKLFSFVIPNYQNLSLSTFVEGNETKMINQNGDNAKFLQHESIALSAMSCNPYWLFYDTFRREQRDGEAILEAIKCIEDYENKKHQVQLKISQNNKTISDITYNVKKSSQENKYKVEVENQSLKKEKQQLMVLTDIIIALVGYVEIDKFKKQKRDYYMNVLKKLGGYQINLVQNMTEVWKDWSRQTTFKGQ